MALWHQEVQKTQTRRNRLNRDKQIGLAMVTDVLDSIPAETISTRAVECQSYARALCHFEAHIRKRRADPNYREDIEDDIYHLQKIYTQIDEPDGIEGISAHLHVLDIDQQVLGHRKAGRWTAAQSWYEIRVAEDLHDLADNSIELIRCMKESGQHGMKVSRSCYSSLTLVRCSLELRRELRHEKAILLQCSGDAAIRDRSSVGNKQMG